MGSYRRYDDDEILTAQVGDLLSHIPGIAYWLQVASHPLISLDDILGKALEAHANALVGKTFCVRCNRTGNHDFQSTDVERFVGAGLNHGTGARGVSLQQPEVTVRIDIRHDRYFMTQKRGKGLGGYPLGSQEPVLSMISGGFDSTVSSFLTMKRGIRTHFCFFNLGGHAHELAVKEVAFYPCFRVKPRLRGPAQSGGDTSDQPECRTTDRTGGEMDSVNCNFSLNFFSRQMSVVIREPPGWRG